MLRDVHQRGVDDALAAYHVKTAFNARGALTTLRRLAIGDAPEIIGAVRKGQGKSLFKPAVGKAPGGLLNAKQVLWPTIPGKPIQQWLYRGLGALPALGAVQAARGKSGDPNESRLSNTLGALGSAAGFMYGIPAAGMLGAPIVGNAGHHIGRGLGRLFSQKPAPPSTPGQPPGNAESLPSRYPRPTGPYSRGVP